MMGMAVGPPCLSRHKSQISYHMRFELGKFSSTVSLDFTTSKDRTMKIDGDSTIYELSRDFEAVGSCFACESHEESKL
ncbi:hypothetical protein VNO77_16106 [Canavalia gladiata]|uniref:Uncharacterized protein n=1 Tax=Canavalia gladiata TaxID=3824 RepID=A0AAN9M595_CANGL